MPVSSTAVSKFQDILHPLRTKRLACLLVTKLDNLPMVLHPDRSKTINLLSVLLPASNCKFIYIWFDRAIECDK